MRLAVEATNCALGFEQARSRVAKAVLSSAEPKDQADRQVAPVPS